MPIDIGDQAPKRRACFEMHYIFDTALGVRFCDSPRRFRITANQVFFPSTRYP